MLTERDMVLRFQALESRIAALEAARAVAVEPAAVNDTSTTEGTEPTAVEPVTEPAA